MSYMMLYKFNSAQNATNFVNSADGYGLQPAIVTLPSGWIGPSGPSDPWSFGIPSSQPSSTYTYVIIYNPTQYNPFAPDFKAELIYDTNTRLPLYVSPNIDPNTITIQEGDDTIIYKGLPTPDWTPPPPTPMDAPIDFQPIYYPGQDDNLWKQAISDQIEQHDLPPEAFPNDFNPYDLTDPRSPYSPYNPDNPEIYLGPQPSDQTNDPIDVMPPGKFDPNIPLPQQPDPFTSPIIPRIDPLPPTQISSGAGALPSPPAWGCVAPTAPNQPQIFILDNSCSVYNSSNTGNNFCTQQTPAGTLGDNWADISVPVNDAASPVPSVMALWDTNLLGDYDPIRFPPGSNRGGVLVIQSGQLPSTALIQSYSPGTIGVNYAIAYSGAISANGTILVPVNLTDSAAYPRISTNFGVTWSDVTGLPIGGQWTRACFSQNAAVMYIHKYTGFIYKSTNGGSTWTTLNGSGAPTFPATHGLAAPGLGQNSIRMRCSKDGTVIAGIDWGGQFYISRDGGVSWTHFDFPTVYSFTLGTVPIADFGMATDGSRFLVMIGAFVSAINTILLLSSSDGGSTWQNISSSVPAFTGFPNTCSLTPDGVFGVIGFNVTGEVAISSNSGASWIKKNYVVAATGGNNCNAYILPAGSIF